MGGPATRRRQAAPGRPASDDLVAAGWGRPAPGLVAVSDQVGAGIVPATPAGRRVPDQLGGLNQRLAAESEETVLVAAGRVLSTQGWPGGPTPGTPNRGARPPDPRWDIAQHDRIATNHGFGTRNGTRAVRGTVKFYALALSRARGRQARSQPRDQGGETA